MKEIIDKIGIKKIITGIITLIVLLIILIVGALLYNKLFYKKSYKEIENIMTSAAQDYYNDNKEKLPKEEGTIQTIKVNTLVKDEYMKTISEYLKDKKTSCKGTINITKINQNYRYTPILNCDKEYKTTYLTDYIKNNEPIKTSESGLYELNNELVYRGEIINNNVSFANLNWKIIKISENKIILILSDLIKSEKQQPWDNRYNQEKDAKIGINNYELSRAREYLNNLYESNTLFTENDKLLISNNNLFIGKRSINDEDKTGQAEKSKILENQYIGLLPAYDYINASIDNNCKSLETESCNNYNYLALFEQNWWLITAEKENTNKVYKVENDASIYNAQAVNKAYIKPVITLVEDAIYVSGNGSIDNPYTFK